MKKSVLAILSLILALALLACGAPAPETAPASAETAPTEEAEPVDFGGHEFVFLVQKSGVSGKIDEIYAEAQTGDAVNDAVWRRNAELCEKYNCRISERHVTGLMIYHDALLAGEYVCDLIYVRHSDIKNIPFVYADLNELKNLDLDSPCWDQAMRRDLTMRGHLFCITGAAGIADERTVSVWFFNRALVEEAGLESPFALARRGEWTVEKLYEYGAACQKDVNADGVFTSGTDVAAFASGGVTHPLIYASAGRVTGRAENGDPFFLDEPDEAVLAIWKEWMPVLNDPYSDIFYNFGPNFSSGKAAFLHTQLYRVDNISSFSPKFGLLPMPKRNAGQKEYLAPVMSTNLPVYAIPATVDGMEVPAGFESGRETCAAFLDRFGKASASVQNAYLEDHLKREVFKNDESAEMLDLALAHRVYDFTLELSGMGNCFYRSAQDVLLSEKEYSNQLVLRYQSKIKDARENLQKYLDALDSPADAKKNGTSQNTAEFIYQDRECLVLRFSGSGEYVYLAYNGVKEFCAGDMVYFTFSRTALRCEEKTVVVGGETIVCRWVIDPVTYASIGGGTGKPMIYLYPEEEVTCSVRLEFDGELTSVYPEPGENGWEDFVARPDGTLVFPDGSEYYALFWEGVGGYEPDFSRGFCVKGSDVAAFLKETLPKLGLNFREAEEMIVYWLPKMQENAYNLISFQAETYTDHARLSVSPEPDTVIRVLMAWRALEEPVEIEPQEFVTPLRRGFTLVEWGATAV